MVIVDANVLIYALNADAPDHDLARAWLDESLDGDEPVGFAWAVLLAFLRLTTRVGLFERPLTLDEAVGVVEASLARPAAHDVEASGRHRTMLHGLLRGRGGGSSLVPDTHLAALAVEQGATIVSFDADFDRFDGIRGCRPAVP